MSPKKVQGSEVLCSGLKVVIIINVQRFRVNERANACAEYVITNMAESLLKYA